MAENHEHHDEFVERDLEVHATSPETRQDPAAESLASALKVSFRLLTILMLLAVVAFFLSGIKSIDETERGVIRTFGRIVGTADPGLAYTWPFPVGDIQRVPTSTQVQDVHDFWFHIKPSEVGKPMAKINPMAEGLKPGFDGALVTGDRFLLHAKFKVFYSINDARAFVSNVTDVRERIRSFVCDSAIQAASQRTGEMIRREQTAFLNEIRRETQQRLDALSSGVLISQVGGEFAWPLRTRNAFERAGIANSERKRLREEAQAKAHELLAATAGREGYVILVGQPWDDGSEIEGRDQPYDLIGQYAEARDAGDANQVAKLMAQIEEVLVSDKAEGEASAIIEEARRYQTEVRSEVASLAAEFEKALPRYQETPNLFLWDQWLTARAEILASPELYKRYISTGTAGPTQLMVSRDAKILRVIQREVNRRLKDQQREQEQKASPRQRQMEEES